MTCAPRRTPRRPGTGRGDGGTTLVELMVVMALMGGLMAIVFTILISTMQDTRDNHARADEVQQVRLGLMQIDRHVRSGNVISDPMTETVAASGVDPGYSLRVYTQTDGAYQCVQWRVVFPPVAGAPQTPGRLEFRSWSPTWRAAPASVQPWRPVAENLVRPEAGAALPFARSSPVGGTTAQSVMVTLLVGNAASKGKPFGVNSVLTGRNTVFGYPSDECGDVPAP